MFPRYYFNSMLGECIISPLKFIIKHAFNFSIFFFNRCVTAKYDILPLGSQADETYSLIYGFKYFDVR